MHGTERYEIRAFNVVGVVRVGAVAVQPTCFDDAKRKMRSQPVPVYFTLMLADINDESVKPITRQPVEHLIFVGHPRKLDGVPDTRHKCQLCFAAQIFQPIVHTNRVFTIVVFLRTSEKPHGNVLNLIQPTPDVLTG